MNLTKRMRKQVAVWMAASLAGTFAVTLLIGAIARGSGDSVQESRQAQEVAGMQQSTAQMALRIERSTPAVPVYLSQEQRVDQVPIEAYVRGVVAAEMPMEFELEALKAQAIAARTYIVRRLLEPGRSPVPAASEAIVTDTVSHQAYMQEDQIKRKWDPKDTAAYWEKLNRAVTETQDQILLYEGQPIDAVFFSTSNGYTENSEDYWGEVVPYLRSVPSPWDEKLSPRYTETVTLSYKNFVDKLGLSGVVSASGAVSGTTVTEKTTGNRIKQVRIGGRLFTGREVREKLGLNSSQFTWRIKGAEVEITTYGYGHGVGMSQWGANGMAKEGKTAEQITSYYYKGVEVGSMKKLVK